MSIDEWSVNRHTGIVKHNSGLEVEIQGGEVENILSVPAVVSTRELPVLLRAAIKAYHAQNLPLKRAARDRPILSLRKR